MRGIKSEDLNAIIDFLYCGEANVFQENLDSFLAIAEELKLKGLMGQTDASEDKFQELYISPLLMQTQIKKVAKQSQQTTNFASVSTSQKMLNVDKKFEHSLAIPKSVSVDVQVKSMMEKSQNMIPHGNFQTRSFICKVCGKEGKRQTIKDHIEAHHLEGINLPCNTCEKIFRSRASLRMHNCKSNIDMK